MRRNQKKYEYGKYGAIFETGKWAFLHGMLRVSMLLVCIALCGCTRREQLVLETGAASQEENAACRSGITGGNTEADAGQDAIGWQDAENTEADAGQERNAEDRQDGMAGAAQEKKAADWQDSVTGSTAVGVGQDMNEPSQQSNPGVIWVHVCGAVKHAAVYELPAGSRVHDAVKQAGGFSEDADENYVNQAQVLADGVKLVIPTKEETEKLASDCTVDVSAGIVDGTSDGKAAPVEGQNASGIGIQGGILQSGVSGGDSPEDNASGGVSSDGKININTASESELCKIPGIGATRAAAIAAYREENGGFSAIEEIMNVSGIKEGTYVKIKDSIKVN